MLRIKLFLTSSLFVLCISTAGYAQKLVPSQHPRVYINQDDISTLQQKAKSEKFEALWFEIQQMNHPFARALKALLTEDRQLAAQAAIDFLPLLQKNTNGRSPLNPMQLGACIYDWCYDVMSDTLKSAYIREFKRIASLHEPYFPAQKGHGSIVGHNCEGWLMSDQLPAGLAIYDEDPVMYDSAALVFQEEFVPARNFFYQAHMHHQGDSYIATRMIHDLFAAWLYKKMGYQAFSADQQFMAYQLIYHYRPDGQQMRSGDTYDDAGNDQGGRTKGINHKAVMMMLSAALYNDPYQLDMMSRFLLHDLEKVFAFIFLPIDYQTKSIAELPHSKYFPQPMGEMVARTGWDMGVNSDNALIHMRIGNYFFGNHQTKDFGTFQIYYKGPLAISSGVYEGKNQGYGGAHWLNYHHQTIAKNGLLVYDPDEVMDKNSANDGGQRWPNHGKDHPENLEYLLNPENGYEMGEVTAHAIGPDADQPRYSFIAGDISNAYSSDKVSMLSRSMLTINTNNPDFPALFFVFDRVEAVKATFKKTWLLHSIQEPVIVGSSFSVERKGVEFRGKGLYHGKLIAQTILPEQPEIRKIGGKGKAFWVESSQTNYAIEKENPASEEGEWRIEVSPGKEEISDLFFHAMGVTNADNEKPLEFKKVVSHNLKGVAVLDYVVYFNQNSALLSQAEFELAHKCLGVFVAGLKAGNWVLEKDGGEVLTLKIDAQAKSAYLPNVDKGKYTLRAIQ
ncbi:hypothetical protein OKW21_003143 [Catalinimonas alkaloidigena]|uniref:hypothetical protein n=1 Tax=Catalinimonas alkaloidigena TaxID=1075417 RepID=UPI002404CD9B|nr:hypothetical protein [Catalinimonas alkaloidigena]MDF9797880.1 hypothetical protein [Catalinimonas alkaloidigena]